MRQIKASEVKPGMEIEWTKDGVLHRLTPKQIVTFKSIANLSCPDGHKVTGYNLCTEGGGVQWVNVDQEVTVLSEPQPDAPKAFGAAVETPHWSDSDGCQKFIWDGYGWSSECGNSYTWDALTEFGTVKVANPDPFAKPAPEVPDRLEEWPEDDEHLRGYKWEDSVGAVWSSQGGKWGYRAPGGKWRQLVELTRPFRGPFTRVTDD